MPILADRAVDVAGESLGFKATRGGADLKEATPHYIVYKDYIDYTKNHEYCECMVLLCLGCV